MKFFRKVIFWIHLIAGVVVGLVILVMAVTGTMLAFEPQIVDFSERHERRVEVPRSGAAVLELETMLAKARAANPQIPLTGLMMKSAPEASVIVNFGRESMAYVNPYTGEILGKLSKIHDFMHFIVEIHRWLGVRDKGKAVTGACNLTFFFMLVSGIYLWWPKQWTAKTLKAIMFLNPKMKGRAGDWNWHNTIGFWAAPLILITTLTGLVMSYTWANNLLFRLSGSEPPPQMQQRGGGKPGEARGPKPGAIPLQIAVPVADLSALVETAKKQAPGWKTLNLRMPKEPGGAVMVFMREANGPEFGYSQLTLSSATGDVIKWEPFAQASLGKKLRTWVKPLHTGELGGVAGQTAALLSALAAIVLVWTGFSMAWQRFFAVKKNKEMHYKISEPLSASL